MRWFIAPTLLVALITTLAAQPPDLPRGLPPGVVAPPLGAYTPTAQKFKDLIPGLIDALKDTDPEVRQHTAMALAALGPDALGPLTKALEDPVREKRAAAAYALGQMGYNGQDAVPALLKALKDEEPLVRRAASQALSRVVSGEVFAHGRGMPGMSPFGLGGGYGGGPGGPPNFALPSAGPRPVVPEPPVGAPKPVKPTKPDDSPKAPDKADKPEAPK